MIAGNLRKIAEQLRAELAEQAIDREAVEVAARRIIAQAEMLEEGLDEPTQVAL